MSQAYGYIRVSHAEQAESGLSLEAQRQECRRYWERLLKPKAIAWADLIADEAVSAFKKPLAKRKGGQQLLANLRRGDHAIMMRFDRAFRSMRDFVDTHAALETMGVTLHLLDAPWDYSTANGRAMLQLMAVFAEWSSRITSERIKAAQAILRQQKRPRGGRRPFGFRVLGQKGHRHLVPDLEERAILVRIVKAIEIEGIVAWDKLAALAQEAAAEVYATRPDSSRPDSSSPDSSSPDSARPDAVRRTWGQSTVRRAVDGFWRLVHAEGTQWISDPAVKGLAMMKLAAAV